MWVLSVEITKSRNFVHECAEFSFFYCSRSTNQGRLWSSLSSILEVMPHLKDEIPVDTYIISRNVATSTRSTTLDGPVDTYVVSRDVATGTRSMTLDGSIHWSTRSKTLEFSMPSSHLRLLGCAGALCIVQGVHHLGLLVVQVYCTCGDVSVFCPNLHVLHCWMLL